MSRASQRNRVQGRLRANNLKNPFSMLAVLDSEIAKSKPVKKSARILVRAIRKEIVQQSLVDEGGLLKSIRTQIVDGVRRVGSSDFKAPWFEFGTATRSHKGGKGVGFIVPIPFMRRAFENVREEMVAATVGELKGHTKRALGG